MTAVRIDPAPLRRALAEAPQTALLWQRLGVVVAAGGDMAASLPPFRRAIMTSPGLAAAWENLGLASDALGNSVAAIDAYRTAFVLQPGRADLAARLGGLLCKAGRLPESVEAFDRAVELAPEDARLRYDRAITRQLSGDTAGAMTDLRMFLAIEPASPQSHYALGQCACHFGAAAEGENRFKRVLSIDAQAFEALVNLGVVAQHRLDMAFARRAFRRALALVPGNSETQGNLGVLELGLGEVFAAICRLNRAVTLAPTWVDAHSNLLLSLGYVDGDKDYYFAEYRRWERYHAAPAYRHIRAHENTPDPDRRLRIGYLSADFFNHSLGTNVADLIRHHDRREVEVFCFAEIGRADDMTRHISALSDHFIETQHSSDAEVSDRIRADGIDILVVLAGHTARNRLVAAARKPAPIMVSYGDFSTTGLSVMDYWLTDPIVHPMNTTERFTEELMRIPMMVLHQPIHVAPPVSSLPALERSHVTFGSFNNPAKIGDGVIALWARLLHAVPESRLILKYRTVYELPDVRERIGHLFSGHGIDPVRVVCAGGDLHRQAHLDLVGEMDIALDPFPFNGCTTTFEALWMGVPVVTLAGHRFLGRMGASFLTHLGFPELVATTPDGYVAAAAGLASDLEGLAALRQGLRERVRASPLCDGQSYARSIEAAFRTAWRRWCEARR